MNDRFIGILQGSGLTQRQLSQKSGVPFSSINGLFKGTHSINKCSAATVYRIACALGVRSEDLLDPFPIMDGVHGEYMGIQYRWELDGQYMLLHLRMPGGEVRKKTCYRMDLPERYRTFSALAEFAIQDCLGEAEFARRTGIRRDGPDG